MSDPTQSPQPGKEPDADDAPAAVGPEEPTLAHPAAPSDLSDAAGFPSAEPATEPAIPVSPAEPDAAEPDAAAPGAPPTATAPAAPPDVIPPAEPLLPPAAVPPVPPAAAVPVPPPPPPPPVSPPGADDGGAGSGPAADIMAAAQERPELAVGAAFAGGLVLAMILKRLAR